MVVVSDTWRNWHFLWAFLGFLTSTIDSALLSKNQWIILWKRNGKPKSYRHAIHKVLQEIFSLVLGQFPKKKPLRHYKKSQRIDLPTHSSTRNSENKNTLDRLERKKTWDEGNKFLEALSLLIETVG